jgi:hypothetical protein
MILSQWNPDWKCWSHHFESVMVHVITWLSIKDYLCHRWPLIWSVVCRTHNGQKWTTLKTKIWIMRNSLKWRVNSSAWKCEQFYSTRATHRVSHVKNPLISNDQGNKDYIVSTTNDGNACLFISIFLFAVLSCDLQLMASNGDG